MEPIALGKPTVIGPFHSDFAEAMKALADAGGIVVTEEPSEAAHELLHNRAVADELAAAGRAVILSRQGATERHAGLLLELLKRRSSNGFETADERRLKHRPPPARSTPRLLP